jgi:hypothetical protein
MPLKLFDQLVTQFLNDNTTASAGMAADGGQGGGDYKASDTYATGDNRNIFGTQSLSGTPDIVTRKGKAKKSHKKKLNESKTIYDYLLFPPEGEEHINIVNNIAKLQNQPDEVYRGISSAEYKNLKKNGFVVSRGAGNTRKGVVGSYVADDIQLAGRFAFHEYKQKGRAYLLVLDRDKLPKLNPADKGNYWTSQIPGSAVKKVINLQDLAT